MKQAKSIINITETRTNKISIFDTFKKRASIMAARATEKCIFIFFSVLVAKIMPSIAALKDSKRLCTGHIWFRKKLRGRV